MIKKSYKEHIKDLKYLIYIIIVSLLIGIIVSFYKSNDIYYHITLPFKDLLISSSKSPDFIITNLPDLFIFKIKVSIYTGLFFNIPLIIIYLIIYLYPTIEKLTSKLLLILLYIFSLLLFIGGYILTYSYILPYIINFFINFNKSIPEINLLVNISTYTSFILKILLSLSLLFQLPIVLSILNIFQIINITLLHKLFKPFILISFILAAILTPPDPVSQIIYASLMILLYLFSYVLIYITSKFHK